MSTLNTGQRPIIVKGDESTWWVVTRYHVVDGDLRAEEKWDVTEQMENILRATLHIWNHPMGRQN